MALGQLCLKCGLCCDGTLFTHVALTDDEQKRHPQLGGVIRQPCPALKANTECSVYADRPKGCSRFVCMLGRALEDGEVGLDEAVVLVNELKALRGRIDALVPGPGSPLSKARQYEDRGPDSEVAVEVREARRGLEALSRRHFLGRR
ncbi:MAG: YkgJ family cysteine cluster protein [Myxococcaceae bacterium]|nr:YkgJ family cysteine cluster protein [Myxococcaceae bacterium]